jgi:lysozyme family protein
MALANFEPSLIEVLKHEGGYVDHPRDPGGATNLGITIGTLKAYRGKAVSKADVKALTKAEAAQIYKRNYWDKIGADNLPDGVDFAMFDLAINSGVGKAKSIYAKVKADTLPPPAAVAAICDERLAFMKRLKTWPTFGKGWNTRVTGVRRKALLMASLPAPIAAPLPPQMDKATVRDVQTRLLGHGYVQVGGADGIVGDFTKSAIRDFRANNGLPEGDSIDDALIAALKRPDAIRPVIAPERQTASKADLREKGSEIIKGTDRQTIAATAGGIATAGGGIVSVVREAGDHVTAVKDSLSWSDSLLDLLARWWWLPVAFVFAYVGWWAFGIARQRVLDHRTGNTSVVNLPANIDGK